MLRSFGSAVARKRALNQGVERRRNDEIPFLFRP